MFTASKDGRYVTVTVCNSHGPTKSVIDLETGALIGDPADSGAPSQDAPEASKAPCVYASAAPLAPPTASSAVVFAIAAIDKLALVSSEIAPGRGLAAPPPWSTGPPTAS